MRWRPDESAPGKILLIQWRRIGDAVLITPVLDALRELWPRTRVHLLTQNPIPELFRGDARVDLTWIRPSTAKLVHLVRRLRGEDYDAVFDFQSLPVTALIARAVGGYVVGFRRRGRTMFYDTAWGLESHTGSHYAADHKLDLLRAVGLSPRLSLPRLQPPPQDDTHWRDFPDRPRVAVVPVSLRAHKRWRASRFAETVQLLHAQTGAGFVIAGGPGEGDALEKVTQGLSKVPHRSHEFNRLQDFSSFLSGADLFLGNDNGPRHIAVGHGVPTVAYFGPQNPTHWTPPGDDRHRVVWDIKRARGRKVRSDLHLISDDPSRIARSCAELLSAARRGARS